MPCGGINHQAAVEACSAMAHQNRHDGATVIAALDVIGKPTVRGGAADARRRGRRSVGPPPPG